MSSTEEFERALKDVVSTKRVSVSKMNKLSEVAKKCFENDAQLVSMLYRTHKSLQPQFKVPSLYAFDALARAARGHTLKHGLTGDAQSGNSATFLLKLEAVLEGLFQDMMGSSVLEGKEKAKKILDIWTKSTTFPPAVLTRLENVLKGDDAPVPAPAVIEPVMPSALPQAALSPAANAEMSTDAASQAASVKATLLALLSQASNVPMSVDGLQTTANKTQPSSQVHLPPRLDENQLKLFQQLAQTVNSEKKTTPPIQSPFPPLPAPTAASSSSEIVAGPSNPSTYWNNNAQNALDKPQDAGPGGHNYRTSLPPVENDYHGPRGRFRGGYRPRGRGRYGDRDREGYRFYESDRSPGAAQGRRSRSRSPPRSRYGGGSGRRDVRPYSPPHRPSLADQSDPDPDAGAVSPQHPGVDEFGREIRPSSDDDGSEAPDDLKQIPAPAPPPPGPAPHMPPTSVPSVEVVVPASGEHESSTTMTTTTAPQGASTTSGSGSVALHKDAGQPGLESFDYSTFDPTLPVSWEALGRAWATTNGRQPTQEELMVFVMEFTVSMASQAAAVTPSAPALQDNQRTGQGWRGSPPRGGARGRGGAFGVRGGGRGGFAYGGNAGGGDGQGQWEYGGDGYAGTTDAIVLGEHTNAQAQNSVGWAEGTGEQLQQEGLDEEGDAEMAEGQGPAGPRMQNAGNSGWAVVRNGGSSGS